NSLFTATSAVCVTGLVVLDTYRDFSTIGQGIILVLIQIGGLGIVTIMTFVSILLGQTIGIGREYVIGEIVGSKRPRLVYDLVKLIILITVFVETAGALILTVGFYLKDGNWLLSLWKGVFHAVSAFCNAGFALQSDSLISYNQTYLIPITICFLIISGGLGFPVISYLLDVLNNKRETKKTPILVKVSILVTGGLLFLGYFVFIIGEFNSGLAGLPLFQKHLNAFFLSVTARTAGFNTIDMNLLSGSSILFLWILMFIGAGSCSTGGGIKVTTVGVLFAMIVSFIRGRSKTILFEKRLPSLLAIRAIVLFMTSVALIFFIAIVLQISQNLSLTETIFETISAFGTVGLSIGATGKLDDFGKFLIVVLMFIGRVNILTFISLLVATRVSSVKYPEDSMMIG
ncbi:Trk family potassium uptake protein, partial [bacterium]|nr:Trk family potassium uptake protein [bacterium]